MNIVMILAGGTGSRVGADRPKQFIEVLGKPVLAYTTEIFQRNLEIDAIEIVCHSDWLHYCKDMVEQYRLSKVRWIVKGGRTFQDSVINGISQLEKKMSRGIVSVSDNILIHYGASPFTSDKIIADVIKVAREKGASVSAIPCYQLLGSNDGAVSNIWADRDQYIQIASPYAFEFSYLLNLYKRAEKKGLLMTVEPHTTSLMYALGDPVYLAYGDQTNIKITTKEDLGLFEKYVLGLLHKQLGP